MALVQFFLELTAALADTVALNSTTAALSLFVMAVASMAVSYGGRLVAIDCKGRSAAECLQSEYVAKDSRKVSGNKTKDEYDMIIVGGGCAGAALAAYVGKAMAKAKKAIRILVVERDMTEPDRIVGELLQPAGVNLLKQMDLEETLEGYDGQTIVGYAVTYKGQHFTINYPNQDGKVQEGIAFHNGKFVMALRECAKKQPGVKFVEATVTKLVEDSGRITGCIYRTADGNTTEVHSALTVACDGVGSFLRNVLSSPDIYYKSHFLGMVLRGKPPYNNRGTVILCDPSPTLVYPISSDEVRMLIDFPDRLPSSTDGSLQKDLRERLCPQLPPSIQQSFLNAVKEGNFKAMPNRILPARPHLIPGCALLGDSLNMRHPLTGGGMTVAFTDVLALGRRLIALGDLSNEPVVTKTVGEFYETRNPPNAAINILSEALHQVFAAKNDDLRDACYKYLSVGGFRAEGPISVLSGLNRNQLFLIYHFFAVALYGVQYCVGYLPTPFRCWRAFKMIRTAVGIIHPLLLKENNDFAARVYTTIMRIAFLI